MTARDRDLIRELVREFAAALANELHSRGLSMPLEESRGERGSTCENGEHESMDRTGIETSGASSSSELEARATEALNRLELKQKRLSSKRSRSAKLKVVR